MSYRIPVGPYHIALEEPYKIEVECEGERVKSAYLKVGFNFRGIEWLAQRKNITKTIALVERGCIPTYSGRAWRRSWLASRPCSCMSFACGSA